MDYMRIFSVFVVALWITGVDARVLGGGGIEKYVTFGQNYVVTWGQSHISTLHSGQEVDLYIDQSSGLYLYFVHSYWNVVHVRL